MPRGAGRSLHCTGATASATAVGAPEVSVADVAAAPVARYPPIVASLTAKSKAARQRRVERWQASVHAAQSVDEKIRILTRMQLMKYVVYPQTFALNADRWYQGFTKTVFLSGLPPPPPAPPAPVPDLATLRAAACDCLLQEHFYLRRKGRAPLYREREALASPFLDQLVTALVGLLSAQNPVLADAALGELRACRAGRGSCGWQGPPASPVCPFDISLSVISQVLGLLAGSAETRSCHLTVQLQARSFGSAGLQPLMLVMVPQNGEQCWFRHGSPREGETWAAFGSSTKIYVAICQCMHFF